MVRLQVRYAQRSVDVALKAYALGDCPVTFPRTKSFALAVPAQRPGLLPRPDGGVRDVRVLNPSMDLWSTDLCPSRSTIVFIAALVRRTTSTDLVLLRRCDHVQECRATDQLQRA